MTSPGGCCGTCECASSEDSFLGADIGASSCFGAGAWCARSAESFRTNAAEANIGIRISNSPKRFRILLTRGKRGRRGEMQVAVQARSDVFYGGQPEAL